jgi:hypothetical protein
MKVSVFSIVIFVLVSPMMAETPNGSVYSVRRDQSGVSSSIPPANAEKWATPSLSHSKLSAQGAGIVAVGWAGGLSKRVPGGFYNASNVRIVSVQHRNGPVPYYLVRLTGQIGETRQTLYAAVLEDGRIIRPTLVGGASPATRSTHRKSN